MGPVGCKVTVMLSCQVVGEVCVVVADQVEMLGAFRIEVEEVDGEDDHDGEPSEPGSNDDRWLAKLEGGPEEV